MAHHSTFMLYSAIHVGSRWKIQDRRQTEDTGNKKLNTTQKKQTMQNTAKQNYPGSVTFYNTWPGNDVG